MKKFYEINISHYGKVETYIFKKKKQKNIWLTQYLTDGKGSNWGRKQYEEYIKNEKKPMKFKKYIFSLIKNIEILVIHSRDEIILIREKTFEKYPKSLDKHS